MPNDSVQIDKIEGDAQISQIGGDVQGDATGRDKNVYNIRHLTVYVSSRPTEPEQQSVSADIGPNPYKGLSAFQENDAERFFGRERVTRALWEKFCTLHEHPLGSPASLPTSAQSPPGRGRGGFLRLLAILGPSGSGKSSVARAGLLPELAKHPLPGKQQARVAVFTPGTRPLEALATILARIATNDPTPVKKSREFVEELRRNSPLEGGQGGVYDGLRRIADALPDIDTQPLILLIDQFEEVYAKEVKPDERRLFLDNLLCAAADPSGHVSVILTLRSDFLGQTQSHPEFNKAVAEHGEIIPVMDETELRQAIAKPAENAGHALDDSTVNLLIEQTHDREGALPLLQFALTRIWDGLAEGASPADTLKQIGGVGGALAGEAQRLFDQLSETDQAIARRAFLALVQLGEGIRDTRRRISLTEVVAHGEESAHVQAVVRCFADPRARLVTLSATTDGAETAEVTHEALLDHWETLKEWLNDNREDLRFHRHLAQDAAYWEGQNNAEGLLWRPPDLDLLRQYHTRAGQDMTPLQVEFFEASVRKEQHSKRVRRIAVTVLGLLTVVAIGAAGIAFLAYKEANTQNAAAVHQSRVSIIRSLVAYALQDNAQEQRERAALLARQASILNQRFDGGVDEQIEDALQTIFRISAIEEGPGHAATGAELLELVCRNVNIKQTLEPEEWDEFVGDDIEHKRACPELLDASHIRLRSEKMTTDDMEALTLNLRQDGNYGYPIEYITNEFENLGEVIVDHATGLMWQNAKLPGKRLIYEEAKAYIEKLNKERFAGLNDWRLPTIPELSSLLEKEEREEDGLYLDPLFKVDTDEVDWYWTWSADLRQIKGEGSPESAWGVDFLNGVVGWGYPTTAYYVRAVRSRQ